MESWKRLIIAWELKATNKLEFKKAPKLFQSYPPIILIPKKAEDKLKSLKTLFLYQKYYLICINTSSGS
jgi:hypothetical protein